ncbi:MAG: hypothetical protein ACTS2F_23575 [Thainema sp.]
MKSIKLCLQKFTKWANADVESVSLPIEGRPTVGQDAIATGFTVVIWRQNLHNRANGAV